jgi:hypothetical protein
MCILPFRNLGISRLFHIISEINPEIFALIVKNIQASLVFLARFLLSL